MAKVSERTVVKAALRVLNVADLNVDPSYQREIKPGHRRIMSEFNEEAFGIPLVGEREDGSLWIVDGLQRITAIGKMGRRQVRSETFASNGPEHEAAVFKLVNMNRTKLKPLEEYKALLTAHDDLAWQVENTVNDCGFKVSDGKTGMPKYVSCVKLLLRFTADYGTDCVKFALTTVANCWPEDTLGTHSNMIGGLMLFFNRQDGLVDVERMTPRFQASSPLKILQAARQISIANAPRDAVADVLEKLMRRRKPKTS
jgi:hypothetical protein